MARTLDMMSISVQRDDNPYSPNYLMNDNIPTGGGTLLYPVAGSTIYKISVDLYTLMMMYQVHALYPIYEINTYDASGISEDASGNRVWTRLNYNYERLAGDCRVVMGGICAHAHLIYLLPDIPPDCHTGVFSDRLILNLLFLKVSLF